MFLMELQTHRLGISLLSGGVFYRTDDWQEVDGSLWGINLLKLLVVLELICFTEDKIVRSVFVF